LLSKLRTRLTFANVVSMIALFVALGGTSYAAIKVTGKNVRNSSLTGVDVRNSSLTTADVKNRSLLGRDFKAGQLPAGPQGLQGEKGIQGNQGDKGNPGEPGPSETWAVELAGGTAEISLPAGDYVAYAAVRWQNQGMASVLEQCSTGVGFPGSPDPRFGPAAVTVPAGSWGSGASAWAFTIRAGGGTANVNCGLDTDRGILVVTKVGTLH
jgi:hypothetical protein